MKVEEWIQYMFKYFANNLKQNKEYMFWQKTSHPVEITNNRIFEQKRITYNNPVIAGIVFGENYDRHSSVNPNRFLKVDEF